MTGVGVDGLEAPIVQNEEVDGSDALHPRGQSAIAPGQVQLFDQPRQPGVKYRLVVPAGLVAECTTKPAFPDAGWPDNGAILMVLDPVSLEQHVEQAAVEPTGSAVVGILGHGM